MDNRETRLPASVRVLQRSGPWVNRCWVMSASANLSRPSPGPIPRAPAPERTDARRIAALALPALVVLAAEPLYVLVDTAVVGHLGGTALASLAVGGTVISFELLFDLRARVHEPRSLVLSWSGV